MPPRITPRQRARQTSYEAMLRQVLELLPITTGRTPRLSELCRAAGVSERTLRTAFIATLGMAPTRYLRLRRLHLLRAALAVADQSHASVATIAVRFGYTDCGRMAAAYHALFGEFPSATLQRGVSGD
ncbi:helix-turn-helix domain-containing protein [Pseudomonas fluorescens]|uniref:AraC family transcriptional regulator n=1 Tax=Pseudomonas fluorescens TaxID=294 RepID=A0A944DVK0_PSEFL|nr:helix-turn-helix domain-containing protein [Pseudomonas fluorescens]MBT2298130.1 AraC family transcriptional regulator [Pseudomonas fluorescens]MBT2309747.1 AraC family transcriptional regulator [Pseudomonas fluorescens]MBT2314910.1 AraC family transcriptional regulator [Pseudomonas fluorescens]MBT2327816.1 AraC family transcriptional regulator [Pseudomonas fluorescens]MBT2345563.1 AraC family transcriptional regulator [Pseudomonas fluorescens]